MIRVKIAELKDHLSQHLRSVEAGAEIVVTDRQRPIARIVPMGMSSPSATLIAPTKDFSTFRDRQRRPVRWATTSTDLLLEERRER